MATSYANPIVIGSSSSSSNVGKRLGLYSEKMSTPESDDDVYLGDLVRARKVSTKKRKSQSKNSSRSRSRSVSASPSRSASRPASPERYLRESRYAEELYRDGVTVVCIPAFTERVAQLRHALDLEFQAFPEFKRTAPFSELSTQNAIRYGLGGTSFVGSPSVFHNMFARRMRQHVMHELIPIVFAPLARMIEAEENTKLYFHQLIDRMMVRPVGESASSETWHRDVAPGASQDDYTFGGWINLDVTVMGKKSARGKTDVVVAGPQYLSGVKGTHREPAGKKRGFAPIDKEEYAVLKQKLKEQANQSERDGAVTNDEGFIKVPPGCILIFNEKVAHAVVSKEAKVTTVRQFLGWRLTSDPTSTGMVDIKNRPLSKEALIDMMHRQAVIPLKSGQVAPMFPGMYCSSQKACMPVWERFETENIMPHSMVECKRESNCPTQNKDYTRAMKSLSEIKDSHGVPIQMHPRYEEQELALLFPARQFRLLNPNTGRMNPETGLMEREDSDVVKL